MVHLVRELGRFAVRSKRAHNRAGLESDAALVDDLGGKIGDIYKDMACAALAVQPALALHCHQNGFEAVVDALVHLFDGAAACNAVRLQPVGCLEGLNGCCHGGVVSLGV